MAKQTNKSFGNPAYGMPRGMNGMTLFDGKLAECYMRASQAMFMNAFKFNQEVLRFATERFQADIRALQSLSRCANLTEVASCQSEFARKTAEAYEKEMTTLAELGTSATEATLEPLRDAAEKMADAPAE
jgi:hypothetical protein